MFRIIIIGVRLSIELFHLTRWGFMHFIFFVLILIQTNCFAALPVAQNFSASMNEDTATSFTLPYNSTVKKASKCTITSVTQLLSTPSCSCSTSGVCSAKVQGLKDYYGTASFSFTVYTTFGTSLPKVASLTINPVNDVATVSVPGSIALVEDMVKLINFSILDNDIPSTTPCAPNLSASSSDASIVDPTRIVFSGTYAACIASIAPSMNAFTTLNSNFNATNSIQISFIINDGGNVVAQGFSASVSAVDDSPVANNIPSISLIQNESKEIQLSYSDVENDFATSCSVTVSTNMSVSTPCLCVGGVCKVSVVALSGTSATMSYVVTANSLVSNNASVTFGVTPSSVDTPPTVANVVGTPAILGVENIILLNYSDVDSDQATSCAATSPINAIISTPCSCKTDGTCSVGVRGIDAGTASVSFTVMTKNLNSNSAVASFSVNLLPDSSVYGYSRSCLVDDTSSACVTAGLNALNQQSAFLKFAQEKNIKELYLSAEEYFNSNQIIDYKNCREPIILTTSTCNALSLVKLEKFAQKLSNSGIKLTLLFDKYEFALSINHSIALSRASDVKEFARVLNTTLNINLHGIQFDMEYWGLTNEWKNASTASRQVVLNDYILILQNIRNLIGSNLVFQVTTAPISSFETVFYTGNGSSTEIYKMVISIADETINMNYRDYLGSEADSNSLMGRLALQIQYAHNFFPNKKVTNVFKAKDSTILIETFYQEGSNFMHSTIRNLYAEERKLYGSSFGSVGVFAYDYWLNMPQ